jgi:hypothetical protein
MPESGLREPRQACRSAVTKEGTSSPLIAKLPIAVGAVIIGLLVLATALWLIGGGLRDVRDGADWVAALGTDDGMQRIAIIVVGVATSLAGAGFIIMLAIGAGPSHDTHYVLMAVAGGLLITVDGAFLVSIGWVAVPFIAEGGFDTTHPFVKTIELLMVLRSHLGGLGGTLIGLGIAATALQSLNKKDIKKGLAIGGIVAGLVAIAGGALLLTGIGATLQTLGLIGSVAWSGSRSVIATRMAIDRPKDEEAENEDQEEEEKEDEERDKTE